MKYRVLGSVVQLVVALGLVGVELGEPVVQDDQAFAPADWSYGDPKAGVAFARLRTVEPSTTSGHRHTFTVKVPAANELACAEHESLVADREQMHAAVVAMGFRPTMRIAKVRRAAAVDDVAVCVDDVEGLGLFIELERLVADDVPGEVVQAELAALVAGWGLDVERTEETYDSLLRAVGTPAH